MEEYKAVQEDIKQKNSKNGLIIALIIVVILALAAIAGTWYYMNTKAMDDKKAKDQQIQQLQKQIDELKKNQANSATNNQTKNYTTKYELLKFNYPNDYTISDNSGTNQAVVPGSDIITIAGPNGFNINIKTGLFGVGGNCNTCSVLYSEPVTFLGQQYYINYIQDTIEGSGVAYAVLASKPEYFNDYVLGKNIKSRQPVTSGPDLALMSFMADYKNGNNQLVKSLEAIKSDPNMAAFKQMIQSASY